jgi:hypothetical protein
MTMSDESRFQQCGDRRAHVAHTVDGGTTLVRCPGIQSVSEQSRAMEELVRRHLREHRLLMALRSEEAV